MAQKPRCLTKTEASWLAGVIDGEGSIGLYCYGKEGRRTLIQMGNTSKTFVNHFKKLTGCGSQVVRKNFKKSSGHKGRKPMHYYSLKGSARCVAILKQVIPYLIIKRTKAIKIIREVESRPFGRWARCKRKH